MASYFPCYDKSESIKDFVGFDFFQPLNFYSKTLEVKSKKMFSLKYASILMLFQRTPIIPVINCFIKISEISSFFKAANSFHLINVFYTKTACILYKISAYLILNQRMSYTKSTCILY